MSSPPPKPSEVVDKLLSERAKNTKSKETIKWLLERKTSLSSIFEADDDKYDDEAFEKALMEVMIVDRDNLPDQHVLNADREDEWKIALGEIKKLKEEDMKSRLEDVFCCLPTSQSGRQIFSEFALWPAVVVGRFPEMTLAPFVKHAQEAAKDERDKTKLKSIHSLIVDLGQSMKDCVSIQAYLSVIVFLVLAAKDILDFTTKNPTTQDPTYLEPFKFSVQLLFRNYVTLVLLIESKIKSLMKPQIWLDIPFEELDKFVKDRLPMVARNQLIEDTRKNQLSAKLFTYLPDNGTLTDAKAFAKVLAKVMFADKIATEGLKLYEPSDLDVDRMNKIQHYSLAPELQWPLRPREGLERKQLEWAEGEISELDEKTIASRLVDERWIQCINDRAGFVSDDLLSRTSVQDETKQLAKIINERLEKLPKEEPKEPPKDETEEKKQKRLWLEHQQKLRNVWKQDRHWHVLPLIEDVGTYVGCWERQVLDNYIRANLYLFWAAADAWSTFPDDDSYKKSREVARTIAEKLLRNYLVMVLIGEADTKSMKHKIPRKPVAKGISGDAGESKAKESNVTEPGTKQSTAEQPKAVKSDAGEPKAGASTVGETNAKQCNTGESSTGSTGTGESSTEQPKPQQPRTEESKPKTEEPKATETSQTQPPWETPRHRREKLPCFDDGSCSVM